MWGGKQCKVCVLGLSVRIFLLSAISRVSNQKGVSQLYIESSWPEWCISCMIYSRDTPFWSETVDIIVEIYHSGRKPLIFSWSPTVRHQEKKCVLQFQVCPPSVSKDFAWVKSRTCGINGSYARHGELHIKTFILAKAGIFVGERTVTVCSVCVLWMGLMI